MKKAIASLLLLVGCLSLGVVSSASAETVRIAPLQIQTELKQGEKKKGSVDITNPSTESLKLKLYVNGFSQVDNKGNLTFFEDEQITKGLLLDHDSITLDPRQTMRLFFVVDGTKLPSGDMFGVIFAETITETRPGTNVAARVGTLLTVSNGTPGPRGAEIAELSVPSVQLGEMISGEVTVKNPAPRGRATGFFPDMSVEIGPWGGKSEFKGPLIFASNSRTFSFEMPSNQFGLYTVKVTANNAQKTMYVFLITGWWRIVAPSILVFLILLGWLSVRYKPWRRLRRRTS